MTWLQNLAFGNKGACSNETVLSHHGIVKNDSPNAHQALIVEGASMKDGSVPDDAVLSYPTRFPRVDMNHSPVLDIRAFAHRDFFIVASQYGAEPDRALLFQQDIAHNIS